MHILLLSPYDALSHRYWREGLVAAFPEHEFTVVALPDRYFSWRFRGNSLTLAHDEKLNGDFNLVLATSMTDLASLTGMRPALSEIPSIVYFHENQFAYPVSAIPGDDPHRLDRELTQLYTALAADRLVFNSAYNRDTFLAGVTRLLGQMPDHVPRGVTDALAGKSAVLPVPIATDSATAQEESRESRDDSRLVITWNHRWEYDKGPDELRAIAEQLIDGNVAFTMNILGQRFRSAPAVFDECIELLDRHGHLGEVGFKPRDEYLALLRASDVVLSTALHEFQGLAVLEAVACGAVPVVPDRLVYPELFDPKFRYADPDEAVSLINALPEAPDVSRFMWSSQRANWARMLEFAS